MKDYIIWDNKEEKFIADLECSKYNETFLNESSFFVSRFSFFQKIGKKDINGKDIVADSSIVEFEFYNSEDKCELLKGFFYYSNYYLCYVFKTFCGNDILFASFAGRIRNIKAVDTIQENKRGLAR